MVSEASGPTSWPLWDKEGRLPFRFLDSDDSAGVDLEELPRRFMKVSAFDDDGAPCVVVSAGVGVGWGTVRCQSVTICVCASVVCVCVCVSGTCVVGVGVCGCVCMYECCVWVCVVCVVGVWACGGGVPYMVCVCLFTQTNIAATLGNMASAGAAKSGVVHRCFAQVVTQVLFCSSVCSVSATKGCSCCFGQWRPYSSQTSGTGICRSFHDTAIQQQVCVQRARREGLV